MNKSFDFLIYKTADENVSVNAVIKEDTIWLTQKSMAELFECSVDNVSLHLKNIYNDNELDEDTTTENFSIVQTEGNRNVKRTIKFYNLDAIISVGYRVNSKRATQFRQWATSVLKEYMIKGFALDDDRMKQGKKAFGKDYFRELLERENIFTMEEFSSSINEFLSFRRYDILPDKGKISHKTAMEKATAEYDEFNKHQKIISDFDKSIKKLTEKT